MTGETQGGQSASTLRLAGTQALCSADYADRGLNIALGSLFRGIFEKFMGSVYFPEMTEIFVVK